MAGGVRTFKVAWVALVALGALIYVAADGLEGDTGVAMVGLGVVIVALLVRYRGRQHAAKARAAAVLGDDKPDVLYLRAFHVDPSIRAAITGYTVDEEQLAAAVQPFGDLVAIGRPGESLPVPGAARRYASDAEWQDVVIAQMRSAPLVILRAGLGDGLLWELERAVREVPPQRLLVLVFNIPSDEYEAFRAQVKARLGMLLPAIERYGYSLVSAIFDARKRPSRVRAGFIRFTDDWRPTFLPLPFGWVRLGENDDRVALRRALRPVFEEHGRVWQPLGRWR
jgi:hypothetical protein